MVREHDRTLWIASVAGWMAVQSLLMFLVAFFAPILGDAFVGVGGGGLLGVVVAAVSVILALVLGALGLALYRMYAWARPASIGALAVVALLNLVGTVSGSGLAVVLLLLDLCAIGLLVAADDAFDAERVDVDTDESATHWGTKR